MKTRMAADTESARRACGDLALRVRVCDESGPIRRQSGQRRSECGRNPDRLPSNEQACDEAGIPRTSPAPRGANVSGRLHLFEEMDVVLANRQRFLALLQPHQEMSAEVAVHTSDCVHIDQSRPVDLPERLRVDFLGERFQRPPDQGFRIGRHHQRVFVIGAEIADFIDGDELQAVAA